MHMKLTNATYKAVVDYLISIGGSSEVCDWSITDTSVVWTGRDGQRHRAPLKNIKGVEFWDC